MRRWCLYVVAAVGPGAAIFGVAAITVAAHAAIGGRFHEPWPLVREVTYYGNLAVAVSFATVVGLRVFDGPRPAVRIGLTAGFIAVCATLYWLAVDIGKDAFRVW